ncbi:PREDICTED: NAD kinase 2, mitochondrial-like [Polistes dominula]|uniref:NAD kinase 2, mitochondrial-like n=1 Tax=Polistes dominula TaxID=743375 RepID=A0ABM1IPL0_POLDO|nr:PREDICTED: NAD kinase 2, mitochondrial-like [Polistes dominula]
MIEKIMKLTQRLLCLPFKPQRVLGITKVTRWDIIRSKYPDLDEMRLNDKFFTLKSEISLDTLKKEHKMKTDCENQLNEITKKIGCNFRMIKSVDNANEDVEWADLVISIGGDGAFLLASRLIKNNKKAIIGINPKTVINERKYHLLMRSRIRTTMYGKNINDEPYQLDEKTRSLKDLMKVNYDEQNCENVIESNERNITDFLQKSNRRVLPWLALNEVYMGEFLSTGTLTLTIQVDDQDVYKLQSSGMCVCTGSGSRSWYRSMNLQAPETVKRLVKIAMGKDIDEDEALNVIESYHRSLPFDPEDDRMSYMIRELYRASKWPKPKSSPERRMCRKVKVMSHGFDAGLVIDGGVTLPFNDGITAVFEIHSEDGLKNLIIQ